MKKKKQNKTISKYKAQDCTLNQTKNTERKKKLSNKKKMHDFLKKFKAIFRVYTNKLNYLFLIIFFIFIYKLLLGEIFKT